jgi:predicted phage terminase large subunit-like protein
MTNQELLKLMNEDKAVRRTIVRRSHKLFFLYYLNDYIEFPPAPFHEEIFHLSETDNHSMFVLSAFRNSAKSTIMSLSYIIWSIINGRAKYIMLVSENQQKAQTLLNHIKEELENNELLRRDLGPFQEDRAIWNAVSITLTRYDAKITAVSTEQSIRGLRHKHHRPDIVIIDDAENQESVRTQESRDKLYKWLSGDVIPAGHSKTKTVIIGSILHPDCLIKRLQKQIDLGKIDGIYRMYPIVDENGNPLWPGRFPTKESVEKEKSRGITDREWATEFMLQSMIDEDCIIQESDIHYYDRLPDSHDLNFKYVATGIDLAISQSSIADYTAMVSGALLREDDWKLYIMPYPINERLNGPQIQERIVNHSLMLGNGQPTQMFIENVAFQQAMIDFINQAGIPVEGFSPGGTDKRARFISISALIKSGRVLFPRQGVERLINQALWFDMEKHDDLLDALVILVLKVSERERSTFTFPKPNPSPTLTTQEKESEAEEELRLLQEAQRGNDNALWQKYYAFKQNQNKKYWDEETRRHFNRRGRGW